MNKIRIQDAIHFNRAERRRLGKINKIKIPSAEYLKHLQSKKEMKYNVDVKDNLGVGDDSANGK